MKKALLSIAMLLAATVASAQGITAAGANIELLSSTKHGTTTEKKEYTAMTWIYNTGKGYGETNTSNPNYCVIWGTPNADANGNEWYEPDYDVATVGGIHNDGSALDISWAEKKAPFSNNVNYGGLSNGTQWTPYGVMGEIYMRRTFTTTSVLPGDVYLACGHDDAPCEYYINGNLVWSKTGKEQGNGWNDDEYYQLTDAQKAYIKKDGTENVLACHVHQNWGGAFADCGLYMKMPGGLDMGGDVKTFFNSCGGYNFNTNNDGNPLHGWEKFYEAQAGDVYTVKMGNTKADAGSAEVHFKSPINIDAAESYTFTVTIEPAATISNASVIICERDDKASVAYSQTAIEIAGGSQKTITGTFTGKALNNMKIYFDFAGCQSDGGANDVKISGISLKDAAENELWVGTQYFNYMWFTDADGKHIKDPVIEGRVETLAWTQTDYDDSNWDSKTLPLDFEYGVNNNGAQAGKDGALGDVHENTNYWVRRTFTMDEVNKNILYNLALVHDDNCVVYINGNKLAEVSEWYDTSIYIPGKYLRVGKNVIATYIQQNWGGAGYNCGITVEEVDYDAELANLNTVIAQAETYQLTAAQAAELVADKAKVQEMIDGGEGASELNAFAKELKNKYENYQKWYAAVNVYVEICKEQNVALGDASFAAALAEIDGLLADAVSEDDFNKVYDRLCMYRRIFGGGYHNITIASAEPADQLECLIYNVGAGLFLAGGNRYGTHATLNYISPVMKLHAKGENKFAIETNLSAGVRGVKDFLSDGGYVDTDVQSEWTFEAVGDGAYRIINTKNVENGEAENIYLGMTESEYLQVDTDKSGADNKYNLWKVISVEQLKAMEKNATPATPVDVTYLIKQSYFGKNDYKGDTYPDDAHVRTFEEYCSYWTDTFDAYTNPKIMYYNENWQDGWYTFNTGDNVVEVYESNGATPANEFKFYQTITGLRPGLYRVSVDGFYRYGSSANAAAAAKAGTVENCVYVFGNDSKKAIKHITDESGKNPKYDGRHDEGYNFPEYPDQGAKAFQYGLFDNSVDVVVGADGVLTLGISKDGGIVSDWIVIDNFRLAYLGSDVATVSEVDYATYVAPFNIAEIPDGVEAYAAKKVDDYVELLRVDAIPEGEAVVLKGAGEWTFTQTAADVELGQENELKAVTAASPVTADGTQYVLAKPESKEVGFYRVISGDAIPAGKGYLVVAGANAKPGYTFFDEGVTDKINAVDVVLDGTEVIYNLQGQKMTKPVKGVNIINGKKVIIK